MAQQGATTGAQCGGPAVSLPPDAIAFARQFPVYLSAVFVATLLVSIDAAVEWRSLFADGCHYFVRMLEASDFALMEPARRTVHILQQLPTVLMLRFGVTQLGALAVCYGLTMQALPLVLTAVCYFVLPRPDKPLFVFPLAHYLFGTMPASFAPIVEAPVAAAYVWLLLLMILFDGGRWRSIGAVLLAVPALYLHETTVLLMPILAGVSVVRAYRVRLPVQRVVLYVLAAWFVVIAVVQAGFIIYRPPQSLDMAQIG